jgi:hypothetical protein
LEFSAEFKGVMELLGFFTLADLLEHHTVCYGDVDHPVPGQIDHWVS